MPRSELGHSFRSSLLSDPDPWQPQSFLGLLRADLLPPETLSAVQACISHHRQNTSPASGACLSPQIASIKMSPSSLSLDRVCVLCHTQRMTSEMEFSGSRFYLPTGFTPGQNENPLPQTSCNRTSTHLCLLPSPRVSCYTPYLPKPQATLARAPGYPRQRSRTQAKTMQKAPV